MSVISRIIVAGVFAAFFAGPEVLGAQASKAATDSMAFPRQFVKWVYSSQGDSAFAHAAPSLREDMKSGEEVNAMATRMQTRFGELQKTDAEVQFDDGELKIYIAALTFSQAPEQAAWVVGYDPGTKVVHRASFTSLSNVKRRYPQAKLP